MRQRSPQAPKYHTMLPERIKQCIRGRGMHQVKHEATAQIVHLLANTHIIQIDQQVFEMPYPRPACSDARTADTKTMVCLRCETGRRCPSDTSPAPDRPMYPARVRRKWGRLAPQHRVAHRPARNCARIRCARRSRERAGRVDCESYRHWPCLTVG